MSLIKLGKKLHEDSKNIGEGMKVTPLKDMKLCEDEDDY